MIQFQRILSARARGVALVVLAGLLGVWGAAQAQSNAIESVSSSVQGGSTVVQIKLSKPLMVQPQAFAINSANAAPRVAVDLPDTEVRVGKPTVDLGDGDAKSAAVVRSGGRARVVLNLRRPMTFTTSTQGDLLLVTLRAVESTSSEAAGSYSFAGSPAAATDASFALRDIDFRRGKDGEGRVIVDLSDPGVTVNVRQQGQQIIVDFAKSKLPDNLRRRLDVTDFGTAVKSIRATTQGDGVRVLIEPQGPFEHTAYQSDAQFVLEVRALKENASKLATRNGYRGERLSLNFQNIDVRALLQVIADFTNINIVTSDSVAGSLTLRLKDVPWDQALDIVLQTKGLDMRKNGNVIMVAPREEIATKEKLELEAREQLADLEPLRTEIFQLNYQKADTVAKILMGTATTPGAGAAAISPKQRMLSARGSAVADPRTNKLFVRDAPSRIDEIRDVIAQADVAVRQVLIEARIVEANDLFSQNLGAKLGYNDQTATAYKTVAVTDPVTGQKTALNVPVNGVGSSVGGLGFATVSGNIQGVTDLTGQNGLTTTSTGQSLTGLTARGIGQITSAANTNFVNLPATSISGVQPASFAVSLFGSSLTKFLNLELSALEADQLGKVVSSPRVLTADKAKATIEQGTELPFQQATASGATAIQFRKAVLKLEVTPQITPEGHVIMDVEVNRDAVGQLTPAGYAIDTRSVRTQVLVENGGTVVIGGIYELTENTAVNKVPFLGDIPVVGNLFKNTAKQNNRTELLVFLTPRVVAETAMAR